MACSSLFPVGLHGQMRKPKRCPTQYSHKQFVMPCLPDQRRELQFYEHRKCGHELHISSLEITYIFTFSVQITEHVQSLSNLRRIYTVNYRSLFHICHQVSFFYVYTGHQFHHTLCISSLSCEKQLTSLTNGKNGQTSFSQDSDDIQYFQMLVSDRAL